PCPASLGGVRDEVRKLAGLRVARSAAVALAARRGHGAFLDLLLRRELPGARGRDCARSHVTADALHVRQDALIVGRGAEETGYSPTGKSKAGDNYREHSHGEPSMSRLERGQPVYARPDSAACDLRCEG